MTVKELIEQLESIVDKDMLVATYNDLTEDYGMVRKVNIYGNKDEFPYCKGDKPEIENYPLVTLS